MHNLQTVPNIYEVIVVPLDPEIHLAVDLKYNTIAVAPDEAITKVKRYLAEKGHFASKMRVDFVVHQRPFVN